VPGEGGRPPVRWLARGEDALPAGTRWLAPAEAVRVAGLRFPKRRTEYLLRRLVVKHVVAMVTGRSMDPAALAGIDVRNAPSGAPYVLVDRAPLGWDVSITDRAGWAVCVLGGPVGCDLELVEPRSPAFVRDFLTEAEQRFVTARPAGDERDAAANLIWSAKESALKVLRTGLRRDTRSVEVAVGDASRGCWAALSVRKAEGGVFPGWWRRDGPFLLTVVAAMPGPPPVALDDPRVLAMATARHARLDLPLRE
jgi:4'-phosphopantetheinyl transferase